MDCELRLRHPIYCPIGMRVCFAIARHIIFISAKTSTPRQKIPRDHKQELQSLQEYLKKGKKKSSSSA